MYRFFPILAILFMCVSCNYKIYINGHFDHKVDKSFSYKKSNNDSCFIFGINEKIPDSSESVNLIKIKYGYSADSVAIFSPYYSLLELAKEEAGLFGANIIKIISYKMPDVFEGDAITIKLYKLKEPYLASYRRTYDSLNVLNKTSCLIHIRNCQYNKTNLPIYLNDSLIGYCHNTDIADQLLDSAAKIKLTFEIRLSYGGQLSTLPPSRRIPNSKILVEKNKEYFIKISDAYRSRTPYFKIVTRFDFY